ncbi:DUF2946 family protein [Stenotrophomonas sp. Iso1]|uniref:DUF2946 family protein n=1 Tax=Stenotrophomonas sp. Iso1 TaxID=2977283 RepID=UPI0022B7AFB7|nr:DUF2946 family protein [Stenotrophomonas sp. Iso1]
MRSARFQSFLLLLAFVAALLMAVAPVVSRWVQAGHTQHAAMMEMAPAATSSVHAGHHDMTAEEHARHMAAAAPANMPQAPVDPHAAHGEACDYCTMASRLLPWLAVLLVLAPLLYRLAPESPRTLRLPADLRWPAHLARGPPQFS